MRYFTQDQLLDIGEKSIETGLAFKREQLLGGLSPEYIAQLKLVTDPAGQLITDLTAMNTSPAIEGGEVPLRLWLRNAAFAVAHLPDWKVYYLRLADAVAVKQPMAKNNPAALLKEAIPERILFDSDMVAYGFLKGAARVGEGTACLRVPLIQNGQPRRYPSGKPMIASGTGWLISSRHLMTNDHVVSARAKGEPRPSQEDMKQQAGQATAQFDFDADGIDGTEVRVSSLRITNDILDYAILELCEDTTRAPLALWAGPLNLDPDHQLSVNIIQHPNGTAKQMAIRNNQAVLLNERDLAYFTDTDNGSSGSAVCNDRWQVLALHKSADPTLGTFTYQGKTTSWINTGTRIDLIIADLKTKCPELWRDIRQAGGAHD